MQFSAYMLEFENENRKSEYAPWLNALVWFLMMRSDKAKEAARPNPKLLLLYKRLRNEVTEGVQITMQDRYLGLIEQIETTPKMR